MAKKKKNKKKAAIITTVLFLIFAVVIYFIMGDYIERNIYVLNHQDLIEKTSDEYSLDPFLVCAVIYTESKFDDKAASGAGAVGLMQIMPSTGEWIAGKLKIKDYTDDYLLDPNINIQMGCWYLNYLSNKFDGDINLVLAAYNAGPQTISKWLANKEVSSDGKTLTNIPYKETDNYVKRVNSAYEKYKSLYKDSFN